jgi:hypothetical protein
MTSERGPEVGNQALIQFLIVAAVVAAGLVFLFLFGDAPRAILQ